MRTWNQKLSSGLLLTFMATHLLQFRFAGTEQYWHTRWPTTLTLLRDWSQTHSTGAQLQGFEKKPCVVWCLTMSAVPAEVVDGALGCHSNATFHRHPHRNAHASCSMLPLTSTPTYALKSWRGHPRCDVAPQSTSFGTVALRERQHLAMAGSRHLHFPLNATAHCTLQCSGGSRRTDLSTAANGYSYSMRQVHAAWIRRLRFLDTSTQPGCTVLGPYSLFETSSLTRGHVRSARFDHR